MAAVVRDVPEKHRFVIEVDGTTAGYLSYEAQGEALSMVHSEVSDEFEGKGVGSQLVTGALEELDRRGVGMLPDCPFVRTFLDRHPEWIRLVPAEKRAHYGLTLPA